MVPPIGTSGPVKYGDRDSRGMDPTATLSRRHALDTMAPRLVIEAGEVVSFDFEDAVTALNFSANAIGQALVGAQEVGAEQLGVGTALGGADFDDALHDGLLYWSGCGESDPGPLLGRQWLYH